MRVSKIFKKVCNHLFTSLELLIKGKIFIGMHKEDIIFLLKVSLINKQNQQPGNLKQW